MGPVVRVGGTCLPVFLLSGWICRGREGAGDLGTVDFESFCYWKHTKCGFETLGPVTEALEPPAGMDAAQLDPEPR